MARTGLLSNGILLLLLGSAAAAQTDSTAQSSALMAPGPRSVSAKQAQAVANQDPDKLFDLPPLKDSRASLIGGTLASVDRVRDRLLIHPFGRSELRIAFDPRTQFLRGSKVARAQDLRPGDRIYVETVLNGTTVFAKTVHLPETSAGGSTQGQILDYDASRGDLTISDELSSQPARFRVSSNTTISGGSLTPGALVQLSFAPGQDHPVAREIKVLIAPGAVSTFSGRITALDLTAQELVLVSTTDGNRYQIQFNPAAVEADTLARLQEGATVNIAARFDGQGYVAENLTVMADSNK